MISGFFDGREQRGVAGPTRSKGSARIVNVTLTHEGRNFAKRLVPPDDASSTFKK
jgi:hypothetical protein